MSFKTNIWEEGTKWNGVIFPACLSQLKPHTEKNNAIKPDATYEGKETGDIHYDLGTHVKKSIEKQSFAITEIDRIKAIDVPWKIYLGVFAVLMIGAAIGTYFVAMTIRIPIGSLVGIIIAFIIGLGAVFGLITFFGFKAEEIKDVSKLCDFYNQIKLERVQQLNYQRLNMKMVQMNYGRS